jgi:hypothetical protein
MQYKGIVLEVNCETNKVNLSYLEQYHNLCLNLLLFLIAFLKVCLQLENIEILFNLNKIEVAFLLKQKVRLSSI